MICTCPPIKSFSADALPLYGTWMMFTRAIALNNSRKDVPSTGARDA